MPKVATQNNDPLPVFLARAFNTLGRLIAVHKPRQISDLLKSGPRLQHLAQKAKAAVALCEQVRTALPAHLALHVTGAVERRQELIVSVDSPAFCARLRFEIPNLRAALARATGAAVQRISVRVQPNRPVTPPC